MSKQNGDLHASDIPPEQLTAFALGQLHGEELASVKAAVGEADHSAARDEVREVQTLATAITAARAAEPLPKPSGELRSALESRLDELAATEPPKPTVELPADRRPWNRQWTIGLVAAGGLCCVFAVLYLPAVYTAMSSARPMARTFDRVDQALPSAQRERVRADLEEERTHRAAATSAEQYEWTDLPRTRVPLASGAPAASTTPSDPRVNDDATFMVKPRVVAERDEPKVAWRTTITGPQTTDAYNWEAQASAGGSQGSPGAESGQVQRERQPMKAGAAGSGYGGGVVDSTAPRGGSSQGEGMPGTGPATPYSKFANPGGYPGEFQGLAGGQGQPGGGQGRGSGGLGGGGGYPGGAPANASVGTQLGPQLASNPVPGTQDEAKHFYQDHIVTETQQLSEQRKKHNSQAELVKQLAEREVAEHGVRLSRDEYELAFRMRAEQKSRGFAYGEQVGSEQYETIVENSFLSPQSPSEALSTFSIDVDTASYANVRRFLNEGRLPPPAAVRIEELVNYFTYSYPQPTGKEPFSVNMEAAECPWNAGHLLLRVGLKGKEVHRSERPPSNLTFLLDVSGSMQDANKLPLLKTTLMMFVAELTENDRVSIVTYAGEAGLRLPPTLGHEKEKIMAAIDSLSAGGSTHGSAGIQLAYEQAGQYFLKEGTNRVILATDGDLNVGVTSDDALVELIKEKATGGTFLTVLGFGTGNLKDGKLEKIADNGNGVYAYIDGVREGRKVLVEQMSGSLVTIAKDVKIQIEFNPAQIASYRLMGYENRVLAAADFNNDKKDAGEIGAGHTVTALYELVPVGAKEVAAAPQVGEPLKYQRAGGQRSEVRGQQGAVGNALRGVPGDVRLTEAAATGELLTLKLRYKEPDGVESRLVEFPLKERGGQFHSASKDLQFAAAVASFGMILRGSEHRGSGSLPAVAEIASGALDSDPNGYRAEFVDLIRKAQPLGAK